MTEVNNIDINKKADYLLLKYKGMNLKFWKPKYDIIPFDQPVVLLHRKNMQIELFEGVTTKTFKYDKTDGSGEAEINLSEKYKYTMPYGENGLQVYECFEDYFFPAPQDAIVYAEDIKNLMSKVFTDYYKWKFKAEEASQGKWLNFAFAIAIVIAVLVVAYLVAPDFFKSLLGKKAAETTAQVVKQNLTSTPKPII